MFEITGVVERLAERESGAQPCERHQAVALRGAAEAGDVFIARIGEAPAVTQPQPARALIRIERESLAKMRLRFVEMAERQREITRARGNARIVGPFLQRRGCDIPCDRMRETLGEESDRAQR